MNILGITIGAAVLLPNLLLVTAKAQGVPPKRKIARGGLYHRMEIVERIGQVATFVGLFVFGLPLRGAPVFFDLKLSGWLSWTMFAIMAVSMAFYYTCWVRFARSGSQYRLLFAPMLGIPIPMAVAPVVYFAAAAVGMRSWLLGAAAVVFAAGHLYVSWDTWKYVRTLPSSDG